MVCMKLSSIINAFGILIATIGTVLSLWTVMTTKTEKAGTGEEQKERHEKFPKEKKKVIIGCVLICVGAILQIFGQFIT